jgi:NAD+ kinase
MTSTSVEATHKIIGIVAKVSHPQAAPLARELVQWLSARSLQFCVETETAVQLDLHGVAPGSRIERHAMSNHCDIIVVLGGDGTLISVARHPSPRPPVIVGVNLGTLGFLTEITPEEAFVALENVLNNSASLESRYLFDCTVTRKGHLNASFSALNDVVITKQALARIFSLEVQIDGERAATVRGDGIIISTPAGSTAYSLAAGGSIVHPRVQATLITPICPHSLTSRPLVLPANSRVSLKLSEDTHHNDVYLTVDGQAGMALTPEDTVAVSTSEHHILIATSPSKNYFDVLNAKLKWAAG